MSGSVKFQCIELLAKAGAKGVTGSEISIKRSGHANSIPRDLKWLLISGFASRTHYSDERSGVYRLTEKGKKLSQKDPSAIEATKLKKRNGIIGTDFSLPNVTWVNSPRM